jgi:hypothetical protein
MHTPFDAEWFAGLLAASTAAAPLAVLAGSATSGGRRATTDESGTPERAQDWGEAPETMNFVGRADELALLRGWVVAERCRVVAVLGFGGIGKPV